MIRFLLVLLVSFVGCTRTIDLPKNIQAERVYLLSSTDHQEPANLFLGQLIEESQELYNFFKLNGAPKAYRVAADVWGGGESFDFFYPDKKIAYHAKALRKQAITRWVISPASADLFSQSSGFFTETLGEPIFLIWETDFIFSKDNKETLVVKKKSKMIDQGREVLGVETSDSRTYTNKDASRFAKGLADKDSQGNLVHRVKLDSENLKEIAKWYTDDENLAADIARFNKINEKIELKKGDELLIPANLVKNEKLMLPIYQ